MQVVQGKGDQLSFEYDLNTAKQSSKRLKAESAMGWMFMLTYDRKFPDWIDSFKCSFCIHRKKVLGKAVRLDLDPRI